MTDSHSDSDIKATAPAPEVKEKSGLSIVWLIPLVTALIGGWLIVKTLSEKGPEISIAFKTAEGIEAGKTKIKYKEIEIGVVKSIHFSEDFSSVILKVEMAKEAALFLKRDTRFWVVRPSFSLRGASNLGTLLSGVHIEIEPGQGVPQKTFVGLEEAPVVKSDVAGKEIVLMSKRLGSIDRGSPIYYQGVLAGEVQGYELGNDRKSVFIRAFITSPYDEILRSNTRFWNVSGIEISVGADGINVKTESVQSLLFGGIAFDTPVTLERVKEDVEGLIFTLHDAFESIEEKSFTKKIVFILFFEGSVRGLSEGAPVEFKGIKIGSVKDVRLEFDSRDSSFRIPVLIEIEPQRIIEIGKEEGSKPVSPYETLNNLVKDGLRAQLQTGSLLTGQLFVELSMQPGTPVRLVNAGGPYPELPTIKTAGFDEITTSVKNILAEVENIDIEKISTELLETLQGSNKLMEGIRKLVDKPELKDSLDDLKASLQSVKSILHELDKRAEPIAENLNNALKSGHETLEEVKNKVKRFDIENLNNALKSGHETLEEVKNTLGLVDNVLQPDSPLQYRLNQMTEELAETARSIRALLDMLERNPNSIIFGKKPSGEK